jgi:hypothetical protein
MPPANQGSAGKPPPLADRKRLDHSLPPCGSARLQPATLQFGEPAREMRRDVHEDVNVPANDPAMFPRPHICCVEALATQRVTNERHEHAPRSDVISHSGDVPVHCCKPVEGALDQTGMVHCCQDVFHLMLAQ